MKRFSAAFALTALAAATVALAQQAPPPAEPLSNSVPQEQPPSATMPSDPSTTTDPNTTADPNATAQPNDNSESRRQALMKDCVSQVASANPGVPAGDVKNFCDKEVRQLSQQPPQD